MKLFEMRWRNILISLFRRCKVKDRAMYAVTRGDRTGGFLIRIGEYDYQGGLAFLFVPSPMEALYFTKEDVEDSIRDGKMEFVSIIPKNVYEVSCASWKHYADTIGLPYGD